MYLLCAGNECVVSFLAVSKNFKLNRTKHCVFIVFGSAICVYVLKFISMCECLTVCCFLLKISKWSGYGARWDAADTSEYKSKFMIKNFLYTIYICICMSVLKTSTLCGIMNCTRTWKMNWSSLSAFEVQPSGEKWTSSGRPLCSWCAALDKTQVVTAKTI